MVKNPTANARDTSWIPELGRSPPGGNGNPLNILAWKIPWTEDLGRLQSIGRKEPDRTEHSRCPINTV